MAAVAAGVVGYSGLVVVGNRLVVVGNKLVVVGGTGRFVAGIRAVGRPRKRDVSCARGGGRSKGRNTVLSKPWVMIGNFD